MNSRGLHTVTQRGGNLVNGCASPAKKNLTSLKAVGVGSTNGTHHTPLSNGIGTRTPTRSISCTRPLRGTPSRPSRVNTAVHVTPRKVSAPSKLINNIGGSLDSLPDSITVRRKVSTPVRSSGTQLSSSGSAAKPAKRSSSTVTPNNSKKKFSAPAKLSSEQTPRMSKDHTNSSASSQTSGTGSSAKVSPPSGIEVSSKKGPYAFPEVQPLPTLKEEKKQKGRHKKMSSTTSADAEEDALLSTDECLAVAEPCEVPTSSTPAADMEQPVPTTRNKMTSTSAGSPPAAKVDDCIVFPSASFPEKNSLERMVSDLIKNNENKKQEIAALKMEINRLKEAAVTRERLLQQQQHHVHSETPGLKDDSTALEKQNLAHRGGAAGGNGSSSTRLMEDAEVTRLQNEVDHLTTENHLLRDHLRQLGVSLDSSPLSDQQKEMIMSRISAFSQGGIGETLSSACGERDWDNKSSSSLSEISVACLQGRIQQMEETHYSTNEELQATLQELEDLREQLSECQIEVQQLQEEKQVILESLTQQTEKLNESRGYNDTLKLMLISQSENSQEVSQCEKTQRLMELLKNVQEDKELIQMKQDELEQQMQVGKTAEEHFHREAQLIRDRMKLLESMVESANKEKRNAENQLFEAQEIVKAMEKESARLKAALTTAKEKITELEEAVISGEKSELADVLERVRSEKENCERDVSNLQRKVNSLICENDRLKDQVGSLQESLMVTRNNAKTHLDDVEWHRTQLDERRRELELEVATLTATLTEAQMTCQHHLEDKRELKAALSESQKKVTEAGERHLDAERIWRDEKKQFAKQVDEWEQFQKDLLTSVRVANDFKTEAQRSLEKALNENILLKERLRQLDSDLEKARATYKLPSPAINSLSTVNSSLACTSTTSGLVGPGDRRMQYKGLSTGESILSDRRSNPRPLARGDSRVKSLIESIECATKQAKAGSRSSSTSSLASNTSENNNNNNNNNVKSQLRRGETEGMIRNMAPPLPTVSPLKESIQNTCTSPLRTLNCNSITDALNVTYSGKTNPTTNLPDTVKMSQLSNEKNNSSNKFGTGLGSGDNNKPISILANKIDPIRRTGYNQVPISLLEKKDPLATLSQGGGSKRNGLLKWCQNKTLGYKGVDITNFSSSWNDGLALCALLDRYLPEKINYDSLNLADKKKNFELAFAAAESVGITTALDIHDMLTLERPTWQSVFNYVTSIYSHFET